MLSGRLLQLTSSSPCLLWDTTTAHHAVFEENDYARANELFQSDKGQEACSKMKSAFAPAVQALDDHSRMMTASWFNLEEDEGGETSAHGGGGGGKRSKGKKKQGSAGGANPGGGGGSGSGGGGSGASKKKAGVKAEPAVQLDTATITSIIDSRLAEGDDGWASLSASKLRALLIESEPTASVSEKRMKTIKAAVLVEEALLRNTAMFLEWCEESGYDTLTRFQMMDEEEYASIPLSSNQVNKVLSLLETSHPSSWAET